jgi:hypothetical protein
MPQPARFIPSNWIRICIKIARGNYGVNPRMKPMTGHVRQQQLLRVRLREAMLSRPNMPFEPQADR